MKNLSKTEVIFSKIVLFIITVALVLCVIMVGLLVYEKYLDITKKNVDLSLDEETDLKVVYGTQAYLDSLPIADNEIRLEYCTDCD